MQYHVLTVARSAGSHPLWELFWHKLRHSRQNFQEYRAQRSEFLEYQKNEKNVTALDFSDSENFSGFSLKSATMAQIFLRHIQYSINDGKLSGQKVHHH